MSPPSGPLRVLCIDGGGYLGLSAAAFLRCTEQHFQVTCHERFDVFVGTSTGGLIALSLASGKSGADVESLYRTLGHTVFPAQNRFRRWLLFLRQFLWSKYSNKQLRKALTDAFQSTTLRDIHTRGKSVAIPALSAATGMPRIFKTNHSRKLTRDADVSLVDVALATSAAPTYFPAAEVHHGNDGTSDFFMDGGVFANNPSLIGLVEALAFLEAEPSKLQILSISTPRPDLRMSRRRFRWGGGFLCWATSLPDLLVNGPSQLVDRSMVELARRLGIKYVRVSLPQAPNPIPLDLASADTTSTLTNIGVTAASSNDMRDSLEPFFREKE